MDYISFLMVALGFAIQWREGKPTKQSSNYLDYYSHLAVDGRDIDGVPSRTGTQDNPYWECDIGGYYNVTEITVTSSNNGWADFIRGAVIEIATSSMNACPGSNDTVRCGQWPDENLSHVSLIFNCSFLAARYVRITREVTTDCLSIEQVKAEGVPIITSGHQYFDKIKSKKVTTPIKSLSVDLVTECGTKCHYNQSCFAFSFSKSQMPNCLLAVDTSMTIDAEWVGYKFDECMEVPTPCPPIG